MLLVLLYHVPAENPGGPLGYLMAFGWSGVDLFFVLSGFLVGGLLLQELVQRGQADYLRFLVRRAFKIWPAYYVYLCVVAPLLILLSPHLPSLSEALWQLRGNFVHIQNYLRLRPIVPPMGPGPQWSGDWLVNPRLHTWSLATEEHFYLGLALWLGLMVRSARQQRRLKAIPVVAAVAGVACLLGRWQAIGGSLAVHTWHDYAFTYTHLRVDALLFGVMIAYYYHCKPDRFWAAARRWPWLLAAGLLLVLCVLRAPEISPFNRVVGYTILYLGYGAIMVALLGASRYSPRFSRLLQARGARIVAFIGVYSYSIYLWHVDAGRVLPHLREWAWLRAAVGPHGIEWTIMALYLALALASGVLLGRTIEMPFLAWRDRIYPRRAETAAQVQSRVS